MSWVNIDNQHFEVKNISVQYNIDEVSINYLNTSRSIPGRTYCDITISFALSDSKFILPLYDNRKKFDMMSEKFEAKGCLIKSIDLDMNSSITVDITSDYVRVKDVSDIRDEKLNEILNKTSDKNNNIN